MGKESAELVVGKVEPVREGEILPVTTSGNELVKYAVSQGADIETLKELMALQERDDANKARKAYHKAMAAFKADPPVITKDNHVHFVSKKTGQVTEYDHATLAHVTEAINRELSKHGLSAAWKTDVGDGKIIVTCTITHELGHSESTSLPAAPDQSGGKNSIQGIGSTVTYLQRYTLLALTGLAAKGQDDDGQSANDSSPDAIDQWLQRIDEWKESDVITAKVMETFWKKNEKAIRKDLPNDADSSQVYESYQKAVAELKTKETK